MNNSQLYCRRNDEVHLQTVCKNEENYVRVHKMIEKVIGLLFYEN